MKRTNLTTTHDDPTNVTADVLIHPTTGAEAPAGERIEDFYDRAGHEVLEALQAAQSIRIGESTTTHGGDLPHEQIVHVPVQTARDVPTTEKNIQTATRTALVAADAENVQSVVLSAPIPTDPDELDRDEVAETLAHDLLQYPPAHMGKLILADPSEHWIELLQKQLR